MGAYMKKIWINYSCYLPSVQTHNKLNHKIEVNWTIFCNSSDNWFKQKRCCCPSPHSSEKIGEYLHETVGHIHDLPFCKKYFLSSSSATSVKLSSVCIWLKSLLIQNDIKFRYVRQWYHHSDHQCYHHIAIKARCGTSFLIQCWVASHCYCTLLLKYSFTA